jgi:hypothetical protein
LRSRQPAQVPAVYGEHVERDERQLATGEEQIIELRAAVRIQAHHLAVDDRAPYAKRPEVANAPEATICSNDGEALGREWKRVSLVGCLVLSAATARVVLPRAPFSRTTGVGAAPPAALHGRFAGRSIAARATTQPTPSVLYNPHTDT